MRGFLLDTNILSKVFKGDLSVTQYVENLDAIIDTTVYIECLQGSKSNHEKRVIEKYLTRFPVFPITPVICAKAIELVRRYSNSHGLLLADALIAEKSEEIKQAVIKDLKRSVTVYKGSGGLSNKEQDILYCVVTRLEIGTVKTAVKEIDSRAFIVVHPLSDAEGGLIKKSALH
jgi:predicted nucleic acid-binding protein